MFFGSMLVETQLLIDTEENQALKWCFSGEMILKYWLNSDFVNELYIYIYLGRSGWFQSILIRKFLVEFDQMFRIAANGGSTKAHRIYL